MTATVELSGEREFSAFARAKALRAAAGENGGTGFRVPYLLSSGGAVNACVYVV